MEKNERRWWDALAILLLWAAVSVVGMRLEATQWTANLSRVNFLILAAFILGIFLGKSVFGKKTLTLFALIISLSAIGWQLGLTLGDGIQWSERTLSVIGRLWQTYLIFVSNRPVQDPILFLFSMMALFWIISLFAGYRLVRHGNPWLPLGIAAIALIIIDFWSPYIQHRERYTGVFVVAVLILVGRIYYLKSREDWLTSGVALDIDTGQSLGWNASVAAVIIVLIAWNLPVFAGFLTAGGSIQDKVSRSWLNLRDHLSNAVASLTSPVVEVNEFYGNQLSLGTGSLLGDTLVFTVKPSIPQLQGARYYWRGRSYDKYQGGQWLTTYPTSQVIVPNEWPLQSPKSSGRFVVDFEFTLYNTLMKTIYVPSIPVSFSRPVRYIGQAYEDQDDTEVMALVSDQLLRAGDVFTAQASVADPTIKELTDADTNYPDWVKTRYLQLPVNFSPKIKNLAEQITAGKNNPYEKVAAVTQWLRSHITYKDVIGSPPPGQDVMEWFLFDIKSGFCNYYATAEVLMLRSVGIPARMTAGFAQGKFISDKGEYEVHLKDAHAWPEAYFPGVGWVEFEPTVSQPALQLLPGENLGGSNVPPGANSESFRQHQAALNSDERLQRPDGGGQITPGAFIQRNILWVVIPVSVLLVILILYLWMRWGLNWHGKPVIIRLIERWQQRGVKVPNWLHSWVITSQLPPMERVFNGVGLMLWMIGQRSKIGLTPSEQITELVGAVPEGAVPAAVLLDEYQRAVYSSRPFDLKRAISARRQLWWPVIKFRLRKLVGIPIPE